MKTNSTSPSRWFASLTLLALLLGAALSAGAATATWNLAGGGTWNATASWTPATIPDVNTAAVVFSKDFVTTAPTFTLDRNTAFTVNSISFLDTTTPFLGGTISVGSGTGSPGLIFAGTTPTVTTASTGASDLTISCPVDVTAGLTKAGSRNVILSGAVTGFGSGVYNNVNAGTLEISTLNVDWTAVNKTAGAGTLKLDTLSTMTVPATFSVGAGGLNLNPASGPFVHDATGFTKSGSGSLIFSKAATGSSTLTVSGGMLGYYAGVSGFTSGTVASGATLQIGTATTLMPLTLNGNGSAYSLEFPINNTTTFTMSGITISGSVIIRAFGLVDNFNFPSAITSSGANSLTLRAEGGNTGNQPLVFNLNAASSYTGNTALSAVTQQGIMKLGINNALPASTVLTISGAAHTNTGALLDLNGFNQTLSGLTAVTNIGGANVINNNVNAATLTISNSSPYTFSGLIGTNSTTSTVVQGIASNKGKVNIALVKTGTGAFTLTGANVYTNGTTINDGVLNAGVSQNGTASGPLGASGLINFGGGALQFSAASAAWDPSARIAAGTSAGAVQIDPNGQALTFATGLTSSQSGGLILTNSTGTGSLTLSTANNYTGNTTINAGKLALGSSGALPSGSSVNIAAGATFDISAIGLYTWGGSAALTASGSSSAAAIINGGATVDMTGSSLTLNFTPVGISGDAAHPALNVLAGTLNLASTTIAVNNNYSTALDVGDYTLISGTVTGTPTTTTITVGGNGLVSGATATLDASSGQLVMHVTSSATVTTTTLTRTVGGSPATYGDSLTFHAVLSPDPGNGTVITFKTNGVAFGTATTTSGVADRCTAGYVTAPQCSPSRAGLLTGRYQQRFGFDAIPDCPLPLEEVTLADRLRKAGYITGMVGKWHLDPNPTSAKWIAENIPTQTGKQRQEITIPALARQKYSAGARGFDEFFQGEMTRYWANYSLAGTKLAKAGQWVSDPRNRLDVQTDAALAFIARNLARPFFLYLAYYGPHTPLEGTAERLARFPGAMPERRRHALAMLAAIDDGVGRIRAQLRKAAIETNTLIFFTSDNGAPLKMTKPDSSVNTDPGGWDGSLNNPWVGEKGMLAEGGIRVPFLLSWPGVLSGGKTFPAPVSSLDIAATALAAANIPPDVKLDGVDLVPFVSGRETNAPHADLFWRFWNQAAVRSGNWKYISTGGMGEFLFDASLDVDEAHNLAAKHPDVVKKLRTELTDWTEKLKPVGLPPGPVNNQESAWYQFYFQPIDKQKSPP